ncbi:MAG: hypothetical protein WCA55_20430, partial [Xanthobacteraceae bacterium]
GDRGLTARACQRSHRCRATSASEIMFSHDLGRFDPFAAPFGYDRYLRIPLKKSNSQPRSEFSRPWTGFGKIHSGGYTTLTNRSQRPASSVREAIQHPRPHVRDERENFGPDRFPTFSTISTLTGHCGLRR